MKVSPLRKNKRDMVPASVENIDILRVPRSIYVSSNPKHRIIKYLQDVVAKNKICHKDFTPNYMSEPQNEYVKTIEALLKTNKINEI